MEFKGKIWKEEINVRDFISQNFTEYLGDESFLSNISNKTKIFNDEVNELFKKELDKGILDVDLENISGINNFNPGYIDLDNEVIVGLQTDEPLKRIINPYGGIRMVDSALQNYGYKCSDKIDEIFTKYRKTHNQGVFDAYTKQMRLVRKVGLLTGLPDAYGRGRIIGDYRRIALYGVDRLIEEKLHDLDILVEEMNEHTIRLREEVTSQINALNDIKEMALSYGVDISKAATNAKEAVQWLYFGYLAGVKENNGAAMSFGRNTAFLDIYIENDLNSGIITEEEAQELIDQLVIKLRLVRHLRTPDYNELFAGDPTWVTEAIGGMSEDGRSFITKTAYRFLHTLINLGSSPEPNITILWSTRLPENFKRYVSYISIKTDAIQYENDDIMRPIYGDDYAIACCVSAMRVGKEMQFFGARTNLAKGLLYAINEGTDEKLNMNVFSDVKKLHGDILDYEEVMKNFKQVMSEIAKVYVNTMNVIHYMHDKYAYEASQMALHDTHVNRIMAFGIAGISVVVDSLSAIKYAKVKPVRNEEGIALDFEIDGDFPKFGNDDDRVDNIAKEITEIFIDELRKHDVYRNARHTLSLLTITSNVVYGKKTGSTPDGRKAGEPFAPGANPMHNRDNNGALASLNSVAKIRYEGVCEDGISNTFSVVPNALGKEMEERKTNLVDILDGYFKQGAHHINVNVLDKEVLLDAMEHPEIYPQLTIRVSGYAVKFNRLSRAQQEEVISRTFHEKR